MKRKKQVLSAPRFFSFQFVFFPLQTVRDGGGESKERAVAAHVREVKLPRCKTIASESELVHSLKEAVLHQDYAVTRVANAVFTRQTGYGNRSKPLTMLLLGPSAHG